VLLDQVYRHRRAGMILVFLFIGLPMILFIPGAAQFTFGGPGSPDFPVAKVGSTPVTAQEFYNRFAQAQEERQRFGQSATAQEMVSDGTVDAILDSLINEALVKERTKNESVRPEDKFLANRLKDDPFFQTEQGEFDAAKYNQWVDGNTRAKFDWSTLYSGFAQDVNREAYMQLIGASARVTNAEVRKAFDDQNTKLKIRAVAIAPKVELTEEELRAYYDAHLDTYVSPDERVAQYVAISLLPPVPPLADELVQRARAGEDFAELAKAHSESLDADSGGDLGTISDTPGLRDHEKVLFEMEPGEVRGPIRSILGWHIYKVESKEADEEGNRQVKARQILLRPELSDEERAARVEQAASVRAAAAGAEGGLQVAAADAGLEVHRTDRFSERTEQIEGISEADTFTFRRDVSQLSLGQLSEVIEGREALFVAEVVELYPPEQRSFEEARADVERDAVNERKETPEYKQKVAEYIQKIAQEAKTVEEVQQKFPELPIEVKETDPFGMNDMLFNQGLFIDARQLFSRLVFEQPGRLTGPYNDMLGVPHFIEVVDRTLPVGETWDAQFETEKDQIRQNLLGTRELQRRMDYMQHLVAKANEDAIIQKDYDAIFEILGLNRQGTSTSSPEATETPAPPASETDEGGTPDVPPVNLPDEADQAPAVPE
jgi:parvulin-like peptidyl-prolyl isomerase